MCWFVFGFVTCCFRLVGLLVIVVVSFVCLLVELFGVCYGLLYCCFVLIAVVFAFVRLFVCLVLNFCCELFV